MLDHDTLTNKISADNGTVKVDGSSELDLDTSTIDQGIVTVSKAGLLKATVGTSTLSNLASGNFSSAGTIEAAATLVLEHDTLTNKIGANNGTVKVDGSSELDLNTSTIDQGIVTVSKAGLLKATVGTSTLSNLASGNFSSAGTIEAAATLVLDHDTLTNKISTDNGTVKVDGSKELDLNTSTIDQGIVTVSKAGLLKATVGTSTLSNLASGNFSSAGTIEVAATLVLDHDTLTNKISTDNGTVKVDKGSTLNLVSTTITDGTVTVSGLLEATTLTINSTGVVAADNSLLQINDSVLNNGIIEALNVTGSTWLLEVDIAGNITGTGSLEISNKAILEIDGTVSSGQTVFFEEDKGELILGNSHAFSGLIAGHALGEDLHDQNLIDLKDLQYVLGMHVSSSVYSAGVTTITFTNGTDSVTLRFSGDFTGETWHFSQDASGGSVISDPPPSSSSATIDSGSTLRDQGYECDQRHFCQQQW